MLYSPSPLDDVRVNLLSFLHTVLPSEGKNPLRDAISKITYATEALIAQGLNLLRN